MTRQQVRRRINYSDEYFLWYVMHKRAEMKCLGRHVPLLSRLLSAQCIVSIGQIIKLENVAIANALQLEAARRRTVPNRFNFVARAKFEFA